MNPEFPQVPAEPAQDTAAPMAPLPTPATTENIIPLATLASPDDGEQMVEPAEGDLVTYQVEGRVQRIEGGNAVVLVESINGQPIKAEADTDARPESLESLQASAQEMGAMP